MLKMTYVLLTLTAALCIAKAIAIQPQDKSGQRCPEANKSWDVCGSACPMSCELMKHEHVPCTMNCVPGCYCPFIFKSGNSGPCILPEKCPKEVSGKYKKREKSKKYN
ncbi:hypothetical protein GDO81_023674 [Engystomops pustulosus]|uniref:TIL domain-containing protein n=1 Tax=Engystomops pustulosus TaxID=76066 RepID=A0AAV6Z8W9_ENGPU|nr:hypothetical protein GDO81_023674 [Engystomops pustulosus]